MVVDIRSVPTDALETDVCVIGSGPAGLVLARELIGRGMRVAVLESGAAAYDPQIHALADGATPGDSLPSPMEINHRRLGGNSTAWGIQIGGGRLGVRYAAFDAIDFEKRDWIPHSGWPFPRSHLEPYYERAQIVCGLGPFAYEAERWREEGRGPLAAGPDVETGMFQFGRADRYHAQCVQELSAAPNVTLYSHATAVEILTDAAGVAAREVRIATLEGRRFVLSVRAVVLACGGLQNARLLLISNRHQPAGLGNGFDMVGRCLHEHPQVMGGHFVPNDRALVDRMALYDLREVRGTPVMGYLKLSRAAMEREALSNINAMLFPRPGPRQDRAIVALKALIEPTPPFARHARPSVAARLRDVAFGLDYVARAAWLARGGRHSLAPNPGRGGWSELQDNSRRFDRFELFHLVEQAPDPENRVVVTAARDRLGCPGLELRWRWSAEDAERTARAQRRMAAGLEGAGLGAVRLAFDAAGHPLINRPSGSLHPMGATRMHDDPRRGCVDADCRVHGVANLFVAGSSTFPTGGYANSTLTIIAMSLRLADLIRREWDGGRLSG